VKFLMKAIFLGVIAVGLAWLFWMWGFCRFYVAPGQMAVITAKSGSPLPPGQLLAREGQKGVQERVLGEGRHFRNPILFEHKVVRVTVIPPGKIGVVTAKVGEELPEGEFLAEPGQKGIWRKTLGPGKYRFNPVGYQIEIADAISIPIGYVGVVTSLSGQQAPEGEFAGPNQKGVREDILQPGLYYISPREFRVNVLEIGINQVSLLGKSGGQVITKGQIATQNRAMNELQQSLLQDQQEKRADYMSRKRTQQAQQADRAPRKTAATQRATLAEQAGAAFVLNEFLEFPSKDGFAISLDMTVEFELLPRSIAWLYRSYGDLPAAVDKVIMPQILSISRMKGSAYGARDFIVGEGREKFQRDLTDALAAALEDKRIIAHSALIRHVNVPMQILEPIQQASLAGEQDLTNREKQSTAKKLAELNTAQSLIEQRREQVAQETEKLKAEIRAEQERTVATIEADAVKKVAEIAKQTAAVHAEKVTRIGKADAEVIRMVDGEKVAGFQLKVQAFKDPAAYNLWTLANSLSDDLAVRILHAGDGTLWTDLDKATLGDLGGAKMIRTPPPAK
jgi:regulator of protease activity HflC (stomatin/prohibitin superfamily)